MIDTLGTGWTKITYPLAVDKLDISLPVDPSTFNNIWMAQVTYQGYLSACDGLLAGADAEAL